MKHFQLIDSGVNVQPLRYQLEANPELWDAIDYRRTGTGTPHSRMQDIWVRYNDIAKFKDSGDFRGFNDEHIPVWYPAWDLLTELKPLVFDLMHKVQGEMIGAVLITKIPAGGGIDPHVDGGWHVGHFEKFYLALQNDAGAEFYCDHDGTVEALCPQPGEIWRFDNRKLHWVSNNSKNDRITLIVCIRTDLYEKRR